MSPLPYPIATPEPRRVDQVGVRAIHRRDAKVLRHLLTVNRAWLEPWEATYPNGNVAVPGANPLGPMIKALRKQQLAGHSVSLVITLADEVVGQLTISDISGGALRSASIGYWVSEHVAGRGVTPAAVALAIDYCFRELTLHRVEICIRPENVASLRVVEKLGLRFEGSRARYIHIGGAWRDHDCFAITIEDVPRGMLARLTGLNSSPKPTSNSAPSSAPNAAPNSAPSAE